MKRYKPIVIIGAPRSGTNMLRDVLCNLDGIGTWPCDEINYIWRHGNVRIETDEFTPEMATPVIKKYVQQQIDKLAAKKQLNFIVEKTCANSLRVGFVEQIIPDAHFIYVVRNGMDVIASANLRWKAKLDIPYLLRKVRYVPLTDLPYYSFRYFWNRLYRLFSGEKRLAYWGPQLNDMKKLLEKHSLNEICAIQWQRCIQNSERDFENIDHSRISKISYEKFVNDPVTELSKILIDIGIEANPEKIKSSVSRVSNKSIGKWENQLNPEDIRSIGVHINQTMEKLGYASV